MSAFDPNKITYFGITDARGQRVKFGIKASDRQRHMYVIGKTGMGKSTLLENMAAQDILNGEGMCFMDPHGSAIDVLLEYVPEHRIDDVVYFAPFDMDNPISFNMMEDVGADTRHLVVSGLMSTFKKIWEDAWSARMEYILTNALLALIEYPNTTLLSVNRMLADANYRNKVVDHIKDPAVKAYWVDEFANYTERFAAEALPAIQNKIGQFTGNPLIRNIIGQPKSSFDVRKLMDEKKILLVNLSKGLVGETNADLLGSMLITRIYLSAMSRAELSPAQMKQMPNFYFYVDEFQSFANSTFANILSEARKYHLNLIIAHQYVEQMEEQIRSAVFGNVGTTVSFRVGPFDAEHLEKVFEPKFMANDLINLGPYQIYLSLMIDGAGSIPFSANTLPPVETPPVSYKDMVIARSRVNFTKPREEVEQMVTDLHTPEDRAEASADGKGGNKGAFNTPKFGVKVGQDKRNGNGGGKKERPKPNFENTILNKLREQNGGAENDKKSDAEKTKPQREQKEQKPRTEKPERAEKPTSREAQRNDVKQKLSEMVAQVSGGSAGEKKPAPQLVQKAEPAAPKESAEQPKPAEKREEKSEPKPQSQPSPQPQRAELQPEVATKTPPPQPKPEPVVEKPQSEESAAPSLDQLRSVLARISAEDKQAEEKSRNGNGESGNNKKRKRKRNNKNRNNHEERERRPERQEKKRADGPDLKSALASALGNTSKAEALTPTPQAQPKSEISETKQQPEKRLESEQKSEQSFEPQQEKRPELEKQKQPEPQRHVQNENTQQNKDEVSPKDLERMMRVTSSDRPPLK